MAQCPKCGVDYPKERCQTPKACWFTQRTEVPELSNGTPTDIKSVKHPEKRYFKEKKGLKDIVRKAVKSPIFEFAINITPKPMKNALQWIKRRLKEPSTYKGVSALAGVIGVTISPDLWHAIGGLAVGIIGLIQVIENESKKNKD